REQHDHDQRAGKEVLEIVLVRACRAAERTAESRTQQDPEQQRRHNDSDHPRPLPIEPQHLAPPQGERWQQDSAHSVSLRRASVQKRCHVRSIKTSSRVGWLTDADRTSPRKASTTSVMNRWPSRISNRTLPLTTLASIPNRCRNRIASDS